MLKLESGVFQRAATLMFQVTARESNTATSWPSCSRRRGTRVTPVLTSPELSDDSPMPRRLRTLRNATTNAHDRVLSRSPKDAPADVPADAWHSEGGRHTGISTAVTAARARASAEDTAAAAGAAAGGWASWSGGSGNGLRV